MKTPLLLLLAFLYLHVYSQEIPRKISYQGKLYENGSPVNGTKNITFQIGTWSETQYNVSIDNGLYSVKLGDNNPIPVALFNNNSNLNLRITIEGNNLAPQTEILSVPYAYKAEIAANVFSGDYNDLVNRPTNFNDADADPSNEIQTISKSGSNITLSRNGGTISINDADADPSNELQTLSLNGSSLTISSKNTVTLPSGGGENLAQTLAIGNSANDLDINNVGNIEAESIDLGSGNIEAKELISTSSYLGLFSNRGAFVDIDHDDNGNETFAITSENEDKTLLKIWEDYSGDERITLLSGTTYSSYPIYLADDTRIRGNLSVSGNLSKGSGSFLIDHPIEPENKYLYHSFVESPDMMNVYNGNIELDINGEANVQLPEWFEALNQDFRYQLTCVGDFAPVYISKKIENNQFKISGGKAGLEISWQVTGIRHDPYAEKNRIKVEVNKTEKEKGHFLHYKEYNQPYENSIEAIN